MRRAPLVLLVSFLLWSGFVEARERVGVRDNAALRYLHGTRSLGALAVRRHPELGLVSTNDTLTRARAKEHGLVWVAPHTRRLASGKVVAVKGHFRGKALPKKKQLSGCVMQDEALWIAQQKIAPTGSQIWLHHTEQVGATLRYEALAARVERSAASRDPEERALARLLRDKLVYRRGLAEALRSLTPTFREHPGLRTPKSFIFRQTESGIPECIFIPRPMSRREFATFRSVLPQLEARAKVDSLTSSRVRQDLDSVVAWDIKLARFKAQQAAGKLSADACIDDYIWVKGKRGKPGTFRRPPGWKPPEPVDLTKVLADLRDAPPPPGIPPLLPKFIEAAESYVMRPFVSKTLKKRLDTGDVFGAGEVYMARLALDASLGSALFGVKGNAPLAGLEVKDADVLALAARFKRNPEKLAELEAKAAAWIAERRLKR